MRISHIAFNSSMKHILGIIYYPKSECIMRMRLMLVGGAVLTI